MKNYIHPIIKAIKKNKLKVVWSCDPMHANTEKAKSGYKTRNFKNILSEVKSFFKVHKARVHMLADTLRDDRTKCYRMHGWHAENF
ncbi:MAG: hypothetical protein CM15mP40_08360 [Alphaproteobacteria bacterium]|nr:MAG: hypothetical protein CM15mP40_08360 [Alphaproteobacteria bacterium]